MSASCGAMLLACGPSVRANNAALGGKPKPELALNWSGTDPATARAFWSGRTCCGVEGGYALAGGRLRGDRGNFFRCEEAAAPQGRLRDIRVFAGPRAPSPASGTRAARSIGEEADATSPRAAMLPPPPSATAGRQRQQAQGRAGRRHGYEADVEVVESDDVHWIVGDA